MVTPLFSAVESSRPCQGLALGLLTAPLTGPVRLVAAVVMAAAVVVTVWTGYGYLAAARAALAAPKPSGRA